MMYEKLHWKLFTIIEEKKRKFTITDVEKPRRKFTITDVTNVNIR